jgi:hypothetical protein
MSSIRPEIRRIDETVTARNVHEIAEEVAVPCCDWITMPIVAVLDGLLHIDPEHDDQYKGDAPRRPRATGRG